MVYMNGLMDYINRDIPLSNFMYDVIISSGKLNQIPIKNNKHLFNLKYPNNYYQVYIVCQAKILIDS